MYLRERYIRKLKYTNASLKGFILKRNIHLVKEEMVREEMEMKDEGMGCEGLRYED